MTNSNALAPSPESPHAAKWTLFGWVALASMVAAQVFAVLTSPADRDMGDLQKILYVHVPAAKIMSVIFLLVLWYSVKYLWKGQENDDLTAAASAEVGSVLCGLTLVQGMIWGRPTWGIWWTWDARLTSTLVLFLVFVGYLALRAFIDDPQRRAQWSAAVGILGAINVPIVYMSVRWWRTLHQVQSSRENMDGVYARGLDANTVAFVLITIYFIARRYEAARFERAGERAAQDAALGGV
jgi:heme exporter protein C